MVSILLRVHELFQKAKPRQLVNELVPLEMNGPQRTAVWLATQFPDKKIKFNISQDYWIKFEFPTRIKDKILP